MRNSIIGKLLMESGKTLILILFAALLLFACGLLQFEQQANLNPLDAGNPTGIQEDDNSGIGDQFLSSSPEATHAINLPLLARSDPTENNWQLIPNQTESVDESLNLRIQLISPALEGSQEEAIINFNRLVQQLVDDESNLAEELGGAPIEGPGGFLLVGFQVTSAPDWTSFEPYAVAESNSGALQAEQVLMDGGHPILAVMFEIVSYLGGAHPGSKHRQLNYDLTAGRDLNLGDLFKPESDYLDVIAGYSLQELSKNQEILFQDFEQHASPTPENYQVWSLTPRGLLIIFEEYQVAPYAAGPQYVLVPYSELAGVLDPDGPLGTFSK